MLNDGKFYYGNYVEYMLLGEKILMGEGYGPDCDLDEFGTVKDGVLSYTWINSIGKNSNFVYLCKEGIMPPQNDNDEKPFDVMYYCLNDGDQVNKNCYVVLSSVGDIVFV